MMLYTEMAVTIIDKNEESRSEKRTFVSGSDEMTIHAGIVLEKVKQENNEAQHIWISYLSTKMVTDDF